MALAAVQKTTISTQQQKILDAAKRNGAVVCYELGRTYRSGEDRLSAVYDVAGNVLLSGVNGKSILSLFNKGLLVELPQEREDCRRFALADKLRPSNLKISDRAKPEKLTLQVLVEAARRHGVKLEWNSNTKIMQISRRGSALKLPITHDLQGNEIKKIRHFKTLAEWVSFLEGEFKKLDELKNA
ncbi:hypothetical protein [Edwardsiella tarda]|uniref:hypothetical protein n=1 Tax=Edwardsiella tarda TaxID=636 RepID=UPI00054D8989|nr:hypothetical protein [Edwardsiella tarda]